VEKYFPAPLKKCGVNELLRVISPELEEKMEIYKQKKQTVQLIQKSTQDGVSLTVYFCS
jgi:hypothetical protein